MRSVVVVLPASMCAMIPMLRIFSRLNLRGIGFRGGDQGRLESGHEKGPQGPVHDADVGTGQVVMESRSPWLVWRVSRRGFRPIGARSGGMPGVVRRRSPRGFGG